MPHRLPRLIALAMTMLIVAGCGSATSPTPQTTPTSTPSDGPSATATTQPAPLMDPIDRESVLVEPEAVAQLLADPARLTEGVIALVAGLGIGIYTYDGRQILPGSETNADDFLLYDFEVPMLAKMAAGEPESFSDLHAILAAAGYSGSPLELGLAYSSALTAAPDSFITRLFGAMGLVAFDQPDLTPLQSWLLLLSAAPPNGSNVGVATAMFATNPRTAVCGGVITASGVQPNWAVGPNPALDELTFTNAVDLYYALQGPILVRAINVSVKANPSSVHEGHGGEGEASNIAAHLEVAFVPQEVLSGGCGTLINAIHPVYGPIAGVPVTWRAPRPGLLDYGTTVHPEDGKVTDENGVAYVWFIPQMEASNGQGGENEIVGSVYALVAARDLFERFLGITDPRLLTFLPEYYPAKGELSVTWHAPVPTPSPSATAPPNVPDPCSLITQQEAATAAGRDVHPGFVNATTVQDLGSGLACIFRDADSPTDGFGVAHIRITVVDLGTTGAATFTAGKDIAAGTVPGLGDDNFYFCAETCEQSILFVRRGQLALVISDLATGLTGATTLARLALGRLTGR